MAKKKTSAAAPASTTTKPVKAVPVAESPKDHHSDNEDDATNTTTDELELLQVDLGDMVKIKQVLDESVAAAILEHVPENYSWDNCKLALMFVACLFAMVAQFAPLPFPESRPVLGACGSAYFVLSGILQLIATFVDRDAILWTLPVTSDDASYRSGGKVKNQNVLKYGLKVRSDLPRFSEWYTVAVEFHKLENNNSPPPFVQQKWSLGQFFDKEGYFDEVGLSMEIDKLFERFDREKYDTATTTPKNKNE